MKNVQSILSEIKSEITQDENKELLDCTKVPCGWKKVLKVDL